MLQIDWVDFKSFIDTHNLSIQYITINNSYLMKAFNGAFTLECQVYKTDPANSDQTDFETNYIPTANNNLDPKDSDGSTIIRQKTTRTGWHYEPRALDFWTSKRASLYNLKHNGNGIDDGDDYNDASHKFYNGAGAELVQGGEELDAVFQARLDANCIKTVVDWQATYDFDVIGGNIHVKTPPTTRAYIWATVAPDIPENLGGSVPYFAGGFNLSFFYDGQFERFNGHGVKSFAYDPVYNSNKVRFTIKHALGEQIGIQIILDQFKA